MNVVHRHFEPLVQELKSIISDKDNPLHHKFFDWVLQEAVRFAQSDKSQEMQWVGDGVNNSGGGILPGGADIEGTEGIVD
jgi:hypothetical protein